MTPPAISNHRPTPHTFAAAPSVSMLVAEAPPAWKIFLFEQGVCPPRSWPPRQRLWMRLQQRELLACERRQERRRELQELTSTVLCCPDLLYLMFDSRQILRGLGQVSKRFSAAVMDASCWVGEHGRELRSRGDIRACPRCQRHLLSSSFQWNGWHSGVFRHEFPYALISSQCRCTKICERCLFELMDSVSCNEWQVMKGRGEIFCAMCDVD